MDTSRYPELPIVLRPLTSPIVAYRKAAARQLVGHLSGALIAPAIELFQDETAPEVYKWFGLALARSKDPLVLSALIAKRQQSKDENARDWLTASEATVEPLTAIATGARMLGSSDPLYQRGGVARCWGARGLPDAAASRLLDLADTDDSDVRRWAVLALSRHGRTIPTAILLSNIGAGPYLLTEWSLHVLAAKPDASALPIVRGRVEDALNQHPRVLEWAIHALSALDDHEDVDDLLIAVHREIADPGVAEACVSEMGHRLGPDASEYLLDLLKVGGDPMLPVVIHSRRSERSKPMPYSVAQAVDEAMQGLSGTDGLLTLIPLEAGLPAARRVHIERLLDDPATRTYLRARLERPTWHADGMAKKAPLTIGVVVALKEEFDYLAEVFGPLSHEADPVSRADYYTTALAVEGTAAVGIVVTLVGRKGEGFAVNAAGTLLRDHDIDVLVSIGISGAVNNDAGLADVVIGDTSTSYLANTRVEDGDGTEFEFKAAGETFRSSKWLTDRADRLSLEQPELYRNWSTGLRAGRAALGLEPQAKAVLGAIAAGPSVIASTNFKAWLRRFKRDIIAVDMESSGVGLASWSAVGGGAHLLMLRGISDPADGHKSALDAEGKGAYRRLAMTSAASYLRALSYSLANQVPLP